jgi:hypothetical protein
MTALDTQTLIVIAVVVVLAVIAVAALVLHQRKQSTRLKQRFGPEYQRTVDELGDRAKAESELRARERRVERLNIVPLAPAEAARFSQEWKIVQSRFVDSPRAAVKEANDLVRELMAKRGYPMGDFESCAADISVDHPSVVSNYRAAQAIALRDERDTEELRKAVVHYRALFDELLEVRGTQPGIRPARQMEVSR